jgi:hypothetical protein
MSSAISNAISALVLSENSNLMEDLKSYLTEKLDETGDIFEMIDDFTSSREVKKVTIKLDKKTSSSSTKAKKEKKTRTKSYYSHWLSKRLVSYAEENKGNNDRETRMAAISAEWAEFKKTPEFEEKKAAWDAKASSESDTAKKTAISKKKATSPKKSKKKSQKKVDVSDSEEESLKTPTKRSTVSPDNHSGSDSEEEIQEFHNSLKGKLDNSDDEGETTIKPIDSDSDSDSDDE